MARTRHHDLIDKLFSSAEDRKIAYAFAEQFDRDPQMSDRVAPLLREAARVDAEIAAGKQTREQGEAFMLSFASDALGTPSYLVQQLATWAPEPTTPPLPADMPEETRQQLAAEARRSAQADVQRYEALMRAPQGSPEWKSYWQNPATQDAYRAALGRATGGGTDLPGELPSSVADDVRAAVAGSAAPAAPAPAPTARPRITDRPAGVATLAGGSAASTPESVIAAAEAAMRAPVNSPEWATYWKSPEAQSSYRDALVQRGGGASDVPGGQPQPT